MTTGTEDTVKVAIVGCGGIANGKHFPSLSRLKNVEFVSFCDIIPEKAEAAKAKYGTPTSKVYADYRELIAAGGMDVVHVCTPNDSHAPIAIAAMEAGYHCMSEKPMAKTAEAARQMRDTAKKTGRKLTVGYNNRFRNDSQYLKKVCESGQLGEIYFAKAHAIRRRAVPTWGVFLDGEKQGGGPLIDIGTHALDLDPVDDEQLRSQIRDGQFVPQIGAPGKFGQCLRPVGSQRVHGGRFRVWLHHDEKRRNRLFGIVVGVEHA